jgi:hypothetical protein
MGESLFSREGQERNRTDDLKTKKAPAEGAPAVFRMDQSSFAPLESPAIDGGGDSVKASVPHGKNGVKATSSSNGVYKKILLNTSQLAGWMKTGSPEANKHGISWA